MRVITAPQMYECAGSGSLFLAGGISKCPDWQADAIEALRDVDITILNPRRANYSSDEDRAREQIAWEHGALRWASGIAFWFPEESVCPIALFELGAWSRRRCPKPILVGTAAGYERRFDIVEQLKLEAPGVKVHTGYGPFEAHLREFARTLSDTIPLR